MIRGLTLKLTGRMGRLTLYAASFLILLMLSPIPALATPAKPTGAAAKSTSATEITVSWTELAGHTYEMRHKCDRNNWSAVETVSTGKTVNKPSGASVKSCVIQLRAVKTSDTSKSGWLDVVWRRVLPAPRNVKLKQKVNIGATDTITISWDAVAAATVYRYELNCPSLTQPLTTGEPTATSVDTDVDWGTSCTVRVAARSHVSDGWGEWSSDDRQKKKSKPRAEPKATATPRPVAHTCRTLAGNRVTVAGPSAGEQCQFVAVHDSAVIANGYIDAIDVWGHLASPVEVCFGQQGALILLDAATSPRAILPLAAYHKSGGVCAMLDRLGTVVLVPQGSPLAGPVTSQAAASPAGPSEPTVDGCPIQTTGHINFRAKPSLDAEKIGVVLRGSTVGAISRIWGWYQIRFRGRTGWIGGRHVDNIGSCA